MSTVEEWAILHAPIACHDPLDQQPKQNNLWDYNIKIVPDGERRSFLSTAVPTKSQCNAASGEASESNQGHNTFLFPTTAMRYMLGVGFMHQ